MRQYSNTDEGLFLTRLAEGEFTEAELREMDDFKDNISEIDDYNEFVSYGNQNLKPEKDQIYEFAENKFIYEDFQKHDSELKKKMREAQLDKFLESCEFNANGEFIDTESQKRAVELFKKQLDQEKKSTSIWSFIKEKASFIVEHSPLKIFRIFRNKEKEFEKKQQQLLSKIRINTDVKMEEIEKLMTGWTRNEKLSGISDLRRQLAGKILFDYIKQNKFSEMTFCKKSLSSNDIQTQVYADSVLKIIDKVSKFDSFSKDNKELNESLNQFNDIFQNHSWSMKHKHEIESWISGLAGSEKTVFAKMMNAKLDVYEKQIKAEPEVKKIYRKSRTFDFER